MSTRKIFKNSCSHFFQHIASWKLNFKSIIWNPCYKYQINRNWNSTNKHFLRITRYVIVNINPNLTFFTRIGISLPTQNCTMAKLVSNPWTIKCVLWQAYQFPLNLILLKIVYFLHNWHQSYLIYIGFIQCCNIYSNKTRFFKIFFEDQLRMYYALLLLCEIFESPCINRYWYFVSIMVAL